MPVLLARVAPQRSTQYAALASTLAWPEWQASPLATAVQSAQPATIGNGSYLRLEISTSIDVLDTTLLGLMAWSTEFYELFDTIGDRPGPFLKPLPVSSPAFLPSDLVYTRRYRGKTNEAFTRFLLNLAYFNSDFVALGQIPRLTVLDPLCGGGTSLFQALVYGWDVYGLELDKRHVTTTVSFLHNYLHENQISFRHEKSRLRRIGNRSGFSISPQKQETRHCTIAQADTADVARVMDGAKAHLLVTDLPYGIQHKGNLEQLLQKGLPSWTSRLRAGGALAMSWESSRFSRSSMIGLVESVSGLSVLQDGPYNALAHRVDRVIRERDVIVARADP